MNILVLVGSGMGGTEKAGYLFAESLARRGHRIVMLSSPGHTRAEIFQQAGGTILSPVATAAELADTIRRHDIHVIHQHVSGYTGQDQTYEALDLLGSSRPRLIETNVFGHMLDYRSTPYVDFRMFISLTSGMQAFHRVRIEKGPPDPSRHGVLFYPLSPEECVARDHNRQAFRRAHGIGEHDLLVCRVGRPGHKWTTWECQAFHAARKANPSLRMFLMEPGKEMLQDIASGRYGDGIVVEKARADADFLASLYGASDLMMHASRFGESFGYTLAEGMAAGLPIITRSTPWGDNAQVELVRHGLDGYLCDSIRGMAGALHELSRDESLRKQMGESARMRITRMASLERETDLLEDILDHVCGAPPSGAMTERFSSWMEYMSQYHALAKTNRYEAGGRMPITSALARAYQRWRSLAELKRFVRLRRRKRPVHWPLLLRA